MSEAPTITRVRHELKRRHLTVRRVEPIAPHMVRIVLGGESLNDFTSLGFDDHVKLIFPVPGDAQPAMRDFTPRRFDLQARELWIDFYLHDAGPATTWAAQAAVGQMLEVGGPKGSAVLSTQGIHSWVFIGDETALPAISRRLEELPQDACAQIVLETEAGAALPVPDRPADLKITWVKRDPQSAAPGSELIAALQLLPLPPQPCFVWVAVESRAARAIRAYLREERGMDKEWIKAAGYWQRGAVGKNDTISNDE